MIEVDEDAKYLREWSTGDYSNRAEELALRFFPLTAEGSPDPRPSMSPSEDLAGQRGRVAVGS